MYIKKIEIDGFITPDRFLTVFPFCDNRHRFDIIAMKHMAGKTMLARMLTCIYGRSADLLRKPFRKIEIMYSNDETYTIENRTHRESETETISGITSTITYDVYDFSITTPEKRYDFCFKEPDIRKAADGQIPFTSSLRDTLPETYDVVFRFPMTNLGSLNTAYIENMSRQTFDKLKRYLDRYELPGGKKIECPENATRPVFIDKDGQEIRYRNLSDTEKMLVCNLYEIIVSAARPEKNILGILDDFCMNFPDDWHRKLTLDILDIISGTNTRIFAITDNHKIVEEYAYLPER